MSEGVGAVGGGGGIITIYLWIITDHNRSYEAVIKVRQTGTIQSLFSGLERIADSFVTRESRRIVKLLPP